MRFTAHSPNDLFSTHLQEYANQKLSRPIRKLQMDSESVSIQATAEQNGVNVDLRVSIHIPGEEMLQLSCSEGELNAAIDAAADKLQRQLGDISARKSAGRRLTGDTTDASEAIGDDDYLTDGEEDVLRSMGALDTVLGIDD